MKIKLTFTLKAALRFEACSEGVRKLLNFYDGNLDENKEINILTLLKSNSIQDCIWALRCTSQNSAEISVKLSKNAAARAAAYAASAAANAARAADADAASAAARAAANAARAAADAAARAADDDAASAAARAADAANCANTGLSGNAAAEREKQKQDLLELLKNDDMEI